MLRVFDLYSKRKKRERGEVSDVLSYDRLPSELKVQVWNIIEAVLGDRQQYNDNLNVSFTYDFIVDTLRNEYGVAYLFNINDKFDELRLYLLTKEDLELNFDVIQMAINSFSVVDDWSGYILGRNGDGLLDKALDVLNRRFVEHGIGYEFTQDDIIRIDSTYNHAEVVKPALSILNSDEYAAAQESFLSAHDNYRVRKFHLAVNDCSKATEAILKVICEKRGWAYSKSATFGDLVKVCFNNKLIPDFWRGHFQNLEKLLTSGVPPVRNQITAHGSPEPETVPQPVAAYIMHMTAASIVFLAEAEKLL